MDLNITKAKVLPGGLMLFTETNFGAFVYNFKPGEYELKKKPKKRSLDANSYAWVLINKIAEKVGIEKDRVYQGAIRNTGGVSDVVRIKNEALKQFRSGWEFRGVGWQTEVLQENDDGTTDVIVYYGSSTYNSKQMSTLINQLVNTAHDLDIETEDPNYIESMLKQWEGK